MLDIASEVDNQLDNIVLAVRELVDKTRIVSELDKNQFSNLSNVARDTRSMEAIITWVQFQMARSRGWQHNAFGTKLINLLREFDSLAQRTIGNNDSEDFINLRIAYIRQFAGQLERYFYYLKTIA